MLLCCYASDLVIKYRNFMAQEVTAHSGCVKYPNYHFLQLYIIYKYLPLPSIFIFLK